jgi:hypothetical protein
LAILASRDRGRQRVAERFRAEASVECELEDGTWLSARLGDVSPGGASLDWPDEQPIPRRLTLHVPRGGAVRADVVRREGHKLGLQFDLADREKRDSILHWVYSIAAGTVRSPLSMQHLIRRLVSRCLR